MADGFTFAPQLLENVMPAGKLDENMTKDMYEQALATLGRWFWLFLPAPETSVAAAYGAADFSWTRMETPDEPRGLNLRLIVYISGGGTSAQARIRIDGDAGTDVEVSTTSTNVRNIETFFFDQAVWTARKDTQVLVELFLKTTGGGTCNVEDIGFPFCDWVQAA